MERPRGGWHPARAGLPSLALLVLLVLSQQVSPSVSQSYPNAILTSNAWVEVRLTEDNCAGIMIPFYYTCL